MSRLALLTAILLGLGSWPALAADDAALARVHARVSEAAGPWCGRAAELGADGVRRCRLQVRVVDDDAQPMANAAQLARAVVLTRSLLAELDEDELAFVLGHEVAHLVLGHGLHRLQALLAERPLAQVDVATERGLSGAELVLRTGGPDFHPATPRERPLQELDADTLGLAFAARAGYDMRAAPRMFERAVGGLPGWERASGATHPSPTVRARAAASAARALCAIVREGKPALPAEDRLLPQQDYRRDEAAAAKLPPVRCQEMAP